jgi:putative membrane protein
MFGWYAGNWGVGTWIALTLVMLLFWGGVITVLVLLLRRPQAPAGYGLDPAHHDAERILNERFARGEIDEAEHAARRAALRRPE